MTSVDGPIAWRPWSPEALADARARGRWLLLSFVGGWDPQPDLNAAATADSALAELIGDAAVPVLIDVDERPELAARFDADAGDLLVVAPDATDTRRPQPSDLRAALASEPAGSDALESPARMDLSPAVLEIATEATLEVPVALGSEALRLLVYHSLRRDEPEPLERAADDVLRRVSDPVRVARAGDRGQLLLALAETALADPQLREELRASALVLAETAEVLRDSSGGFRAWADVEGERSPSVTAEGNARLARGLLLAGAAFGESSWVEAGGRAVDFLVRELRAGAAGVYHAWDGAPGRLGWLGDQTAATLALLTAYEVVGNVDYFEHAVELARVVDDRWATAGGRLVESWELGDEGGPFDEPYFRLATNVEFAEVQLWIGRLTHDERYLEAALRIVSAFAPDLEVPSEAQAAFARVADRLLSAEPEIVVVASAPLGEPDRSADPLHAAALRLRTAARSVQRLHAEEDIDRLEMLGVPATPSGVAYVRVGSEVSAPIDEADRLASAVQETYLAFIG